MKKLAAAEVSRAGRTARSWNHETKKVELDSADSLEFHFSLSSKGGGITDVKFTVGPEDFPALTLAMMKTDRAVAMREMASALSTEVGKQVEYDKVTARKARQSVVEAAETEFDSAPKNRNHAERLTRDVVRQLVTDLNKEEVAVSDATSGGA